MPSLSEETNGRIERLMPGATIGIIGGGQLGRMMALSARYMGFRIGVLDPTPDCPAAQVADFQVTAEYDDIAAIRDLFPNGSYPHASTPKEPTYYEIPPEALKDEAFAAMIAEAEKYVGYPYVWGGSSPSTSFDCSGFISWVINHSGWNVGRQTAQGLYNICTPVSPEQAKPGDLVFFVGTYDTAGMSHVGLYVGNSVMLHCGDPISYTNLNSKYWQEHFYSYGRLP